MNEKIKERKRGGERERGRESAASINGFIALNQAINLHVKWHY
jgi:hypothetical protein